ncbi:hypothetical protein CAL29_21310 [Bordetella genomosp. 10]|uniref:NADH:quinone oxidoreductase/Mrp antiporter transmembrane domain-containing protein n=1 Tax=Bordetella genomosp. 10 TaxID=1416804 RepID=A0A261RZN5_9BORD|nr:proton-conducting transporter membrane subunit [Bordetella genomosp. 10]OZI30556.1 hypothetical protein CAL29_21310 [Bordetella genomosp. 10]
MGDLLAWSAAPLLAGLLLAFARWPRSARLLIGLAAALGAASAAWGLAHEGQALALPWRVAGQAVALRYDTAARWLMLFGLAPAALAIWMGASARTAQAGWLIGASLSLLGAWGVFGSQDGYTLLIAWEVMSLGGAVMLLSERLDRDAGKAVLFMLALLEAGAVAMLLAVLLLGRGGAGLGVDDLVQGGLALGPAARGFVGILLLIGFGAKLGILPFYEWLPRAYGVGTGATGVVLSGVVLNAGFFGLSRALMQWLPASAGLGTVVAAAGVISAILAALQAFQQDDWRRLLAFSSAENASIAVTALGAALMFRADRHPELAALAWTVALLHMGGHALAKGGLLLCADAVHRASGRYAIAQDGWLRRAPWGFRIGALLCTMSLAAIPPQIGFASEWFVFQTLFQGFHLGSLPGRLVLALAGAGIALTAAVAFATFVKLFGLGLLGAPADPGEAPPIARRYGASVAILGLGVLVAAIGLPRWLPLLDELATASLGVHGGQAMVKGWLLVPLTDTFAFISPSKLVIALPLLSLIPLALLAISARHRRRITPVWYGGMRERPAVVRTTSLSFSNAMRTFYRFIYQPTHDTRRDTDGGPYFPSTLEFEHGVTDVFDLLVFRPLKNAVWRAAGYLRALQSGDLNFYLALIGGLLVLILCLTFR